MELSLVMDMVEERMSAAKTYIDEERMDDARAEFIRMAEETLEALKPPEPPAEEKDQAQKQDGVAAS